MPVGFPAALNAKAELINGLFDVRVENYEQNPGYEDEDDAITDQPSHGALDFHLVPMKP